MAVHNAAQKQRIHYARGYPSTLRGRVCHRARTGAAAVEFAVVMPVFLLLLAGIIEFGQAFHVEHCLSNAARRGARAAIVTGATSSRVTEKVKADLIAVLPVKATDITVTVTLNGQSALDLAAATEGDEVRLTASIPFSKAGIGFFSNWFAGKTLSSTSTLEHE